MHASLFFYPPLTIGVVFTLENILMVTPITLAHGLQATPPNQPVGQLFQGGASPMWTMPKRTDSRTRIIWMEGREWRVQEQSDSRADREERALVFSSAGESHTVHEYHWLWFGFMDDELAALYKSRRKAADSAAYHPAVTSERELSGASPRLPR